MNEQELFIVVFIIVIIISKSNYFHNIALTFSYISNLPLDDMFKSFTCLELYHCMTVLLKQKQQKICL